MKTCFKCKRILPIEEFYRHPQMGDGRLGKCKDCTKIDTRKRDERLMSSADTALAERLRHRIKSQKYRFSGRVKKESAEERNERIKRYKLKYPDKKRAHAKLSKAIRSGRVTRMPCSVCGDHKSQGHHEDYSKPYDVIWLCSKHHGEHHARKNDEQLAAKLNERRC